MTDEELQAILAEAAAAHAADIERLAESDDDQLYYLTHLDELPDPMTDGLEWGVVDLEVRCAACGHVERCDRVHLPYMGPSFSCPACGPLRDPVIGFLEPPTSRRARQRWDSRVSSGVLAVRAEPLSPRRPGG